MAPSQDQGEPAGADNPDNPGNADNPDYPNDPGNADNPDNPDDPGNADNPDDPGNADNPDDPAGQAIDAAGATVPAVEEELSRAGAEAPAVAAPRSEVMPYQQAVAVASRLAPGFVVPNDCHPPPLDSPYSMPNAPRAYRSGVHAGVDFLCSTRRPRGDGSR